MPAQLCLLLTPELPSARCLFSMMSQFKLFPLRTTVLGVFFVATLKIGGLSHLASSVFLGTLLHLHKHRHLLIYQFSQEQAEVWAVRCGGPATTDNMPGTAQGVTEDKAQPRGKPYLTSMSVCARQAALEDCVMFLCVFKQSLAQQSP